LSLRRQEASACFETGSVGYSATRQPNRFDGLGLKTSAWKVEPTSVTQAQSSFLDAVPVGTAELDDALILRKVPVLWEPLSNLQLRAEPAHDVPSSRDAPCRADERTVHSG